MERRKIREQHQHSLDTSRSQGFDYDALYRLTDATGLYGTLAYDYDAVGNRTEQTANSAVTTYSYAAASNRLTSLTDSSGSTNITYDAAGNILADDANTYSYDDRNRLAQANSTHDYQHNALGQRVSKTAGSTTTLFAYDEAGHLIGEYDALGTPIREYLWFGDQPLAINDQSGTTDATYYLHTDHLNTPQQATDASQTIVWSADYQPFGDVTETVTTIAQPLRFPGQYYDAETGLNYNYFRSYNPGTGRYTQSDPIGLVGGLNQYAYVFSIPTRLTDPTGEAAAGVALGGFGADVLTPDPSDLAWPKWLGWGLVIGGAIIYDMCADNEQSCPPCKLADGTVVPVGTVAYRWDKLPSDVQQHGIYGDHLNLYRANQNPNNCQCFWQPIGTVEPPPQPDWVPIQPFMN